MTTKEMIAVMQAFEEGKTIEYATKWVSLTNKWEEIDDPAWDWNSCIYRVKPEPREFYVIEYTYRGGEEFYSALWLDKGPAQAQAQMYLAEGGCAARVITLREVLDES